MTLSFLSGGPRLCPTCQALGIRSTVKLDTLHFIHRVYWDEDGKYHPAVHTYKMRCSRDHEFLSDFEITNLV